ncbi:hypothetical protein HMN09_00112900 [Mycena chlorophos]|uniref:Uncharacterized protein n=1 Tax=Mycena chlorophos TaxID=658473 RepID=A0A8H6TV61_MYCCL|nr:hypothetical protein HMN09_00112900 [Mycena chlorophos]
MPSIHESRAAKWGTSVFLAEWLANIFAYCTSSLEGKKAFWEWLVLQHGAERAKQELIQMTSNRPESSTSSSSEKFFRLAAQEFGLFLTSFDCMVALELHAGTSELAMREYLNFALDTDACAPPRTQPAPRRFRGESMDDYRGENLADLKARRTQALLNGGHNPDIDWYIVRMIVFSEVDKAADTRSIWHNDFDIFMAKMASLAPAMLLDRVVLQEGSPEREHFNQMELAFRSSTFLQSFSHMTWATFATLFPVFAMVGSSTAAIEEEYQKSDVFMWRLVATWSHVWYLCGQRWQRILELVSGSEHYKAFFTRYRLTTGEIRVKPNREYLRTLGDKITELDRQVVEFIGGESDFWIESRFLDRLNELLKAHPDESSKFNKDVLEEFGELETLVECKLQLFDTPFGRKLIAYAQSKDAKCMQDPSFLKYISLIDPDKLLWAKPEDTDWSYACTVTRSVGNTWRQLAVKRASMMHFYGLLEVLKKDLKSPKFEDIPANVDKAVADFAEEGRVVDPEDLTRVFLFAEAWGRADYDMGRACLELARPGPGMMGGLAHQFGVFQSSKGDDGAWQGPLGRMLQPHQRQELTDRSILPPGVKVAGLIEAYGLTSVEGTGLGLQQTVEDRWEREESDDAGQEVDEKRDAQSEDKVEQSYRDWQLCNLDGWPGEEELSDVLPTQFKLGKKVVKVFHRILTQHESTMQSDTTKSSQVLRWPDFEKAMKRIGFTTTHTRLGTSVRFDAPAKGERPIAFNRPSPDPVLTATDIKWQVSVRPKQRV